MKTYKILFAFYPFNMETVVPDKEVVEAENLGEAFRIVREKYGEDVEIFKVAARKYYNEFDDNFERIH